MSTFERKLWLLDQEINLRGFRVDRALARAAVSACAAEKRALDRKVQHITAGGIDSATQRARIVSFLNAHGVNPPNLTAATMDLLLDGDMLSDTCREILEARQRVSKASTAKYERLLEATSPDGRLRGVLQYCGASRTGRWAGRLFQPHNLPRAKMSAEEVETYVRAVKAGAADLVTDNVHKLCAELGRSVIIADKNCELLVGDYSAIEGRVLAWLAGETWKLRTYANNEDIYTLTFNFLYGRAKDAEVTPDQRQHGKVFELSMGYEAGVNGLLTFSRGYGVDPHELGAGAWRAASKQIRDRAEQNYAFAIVRGDPTVLVLTKNLWKQLEAAKLMWRGISPRTVHLWKLYQRAAFRAIRAPGKMLRAGRCVFICKNDMLGVRLPSGRVLIYAKPRIGEDSDGREHLTYLGPYGGRVFLYGGKLAENITQAISRDLLGNAMIEADRAGFPIVLHVHDEIVAEVEKSSLFALDDLNEVMCRKPTWADGLPLAVEGFTTRRYRKD